MLTAALLLTALFGVGTLSVSAADGDACTSTAGCGGTYENGFCPYCSGYEEPAQDGDGYYEIDNAGKLFWFAVKVNQDNAAANARLTADIEITSSALGTRYWTPIGVRGEGFSGTFDGQGYTISHITCDMTIVSDDVYASLFYAVSANGVVKNVGILDSTFKSKVIVGSIAVFNDGTVQNCFSNANVNAIYHSSYTNYFGGIVGLNSGTVENCHFSGATVAERGYVGGVAGYAQTMTNCKNSVDLDVSQGGAYVGGIAGYMAANREAALMVSGNQNTGTVSGVEYVGGIAGMMSVKEYQNNDTITVSDNKNTGEITGSKNNG